MPREPKLYIRELPSISNSKTLLKKLAETGLTEVEIANVFGLTFNHFKSILEVQPELQTILDDAKQVPNRKVEASLYKRALGYQVREVTKTAGRETKVVIKEIAPDVVADIFWLKNRDPKRWRDAIDMNFTLRDRLGRAHSALQSGHAPMQVEHQGGNGSDTSEDS
jgi:hypothetical protein